MNIQDVKEQFVRLNEEIKRAKDLQGQYHFDFDDPEEVLLEIKLEGVYDLLDDLTTKLDTISKEVVAEDILLKNSNGKYQLGDYVLSSGSNVEYWDDKDKAWRIDRIEHFNQDYGLYILGENNISGIRARIRR